VTPHLALPALLCNQVHQLPRCRSTVLSSASDIDVVQDAHPTTPTVTPLCELESDEVLATRMKQNFLKGLHVNHEARYQTLQSLNEIKDKAWKEMEERRDFLLRYSKSLTEQDILLKNKQPGKAL
jgi:hypothetical protein